MAWTFKPGDVVQYGTCDHLWKIREIHPQDSGSKIYVQGVDPSPGGATKSMAIIFCLNDHEDMPLVARADEI